MSRASVRAALAGFLGGGAVVGLTAVHTSQHKITDGSEYFAAVGDRSGMLAFVFIERELEARRSLAGPSHGYKKISYDVGLVCQFRHNGENPAFDQDAGAQAMDDYDATIELIKQKIRSDRTLGGAVFQIGEGDTLHGDDIEILSDLPTVDNENGQIHIWSVVRFKVIEFLNP